jgi:ribosomal protein S18 acetylase RimI-like enzyme
MSNNNENSFNIVIRKAKSHDAEDIYNVGRTTWLSCYPNKKYGVEKSDIEKKYENKAERIQKFHKNLKKEDSSKCTWVACIDESVVGFVGVYQEDNKKQIGAIYVLPEFQGRGAGTKLLKKALDFYRKADEIWLELAVYNDAAKNFYEKFGFNVVANSESDHPIIDNKTIPTIKMKKTITN